MAEKKQGLWIAFEGNDGSGKSTQITKVAEYLQGLGVEVVATREPGGNAYSEKLRGLIFDQEIAHDPVTQLYLFAAARRRNILVTVKPSIKAGKIVLSDRSEGSTYDYQHYQFGLSFGDVQQINDYATEGIKPNFTFVLDVDPEIGWQRMQAAKGVEANHFDMASQKDRIKRRKGYLELAKKFPHWILIDANQGKEKVFQDIVGAIQKNKILSLQL